MLTTTLSTRCLAVRIRQAYLRRRPWWSSSDPCSPVWSIAAESLVEAHRADPRLPLDAELFVAAQPRHDAIADPSGDLIGPEPVHRYRRRVFQIVRGLREELRSELRRVRRRTRRGEPIESVLFQVDRRISPLGRYVASVRANRPDLASRLRSEALRQHQSCPLYRLASEGLLPEGTYPAAATLPFPINPMPTGVVGWN